VTGDELEALQLDATTNGASWTLPDGNNKEAATANSVGFTKYTVINVTETTRDPTTSATQLLPFLAAFASTGQVIIFLFCN
jgi:hypothetical protein